MMRYLEYWSYAFIHAIYIKNWLPHQEITIAPYKALSGSQPGKLRIFGPRLYAKKLGKHNAKLDNHTSNGIFLGYTSTNKHVYNASS